MLKTSQGYLYKFKSIPKTVLNFSNTVWNFIIKNMSRTFKIVALNLFVFGIATKTLLLILEKFEQINQKQNLAMMPYRNVGEYWPKLFVKLSGFGC